MSNHIIRYKDKNYELFGDNNLMCKDCAFNELSDIGLCGSSECSFRGGVYRLSVSECRKLKINEILEDDKT